MKTFDIRSLALGALGLLTIFAPAAPAQAQAGQVVCFSFDGTDNLSGVDSTGAASRTAARVGGQTFFVGGAGSSPADCATSLANQLNAAGYTANTVGANVVCVTAGKNGAALTTGGAIGTTDTGLDGINTKVHTPPVKPGKPKPPKKLKSNGVTIPKAKPGASVAVPMTITIEIEVEVWIFGVKVTVKIKVQVNLQVGMDAGQINQAMCSSLISAGFSPNDVVTQGVVHNAPIPAFGFDHDSQGRPVTHVLLWQPIQTEILPMELTSGSFPMMGGTSYGESSFPGLYQGLNGDPSIGGFYNPYVGNAQPGDLAILGLSEFDYEMPYFSGTILIDPNRMVILPPTVVDPLGGAELILPIPPDPAFMGFELHSQWLIRGNRDELTNGVKTTIGG